MAQLIDWLASVVFVPFFDRLFGAKSPGKKPLRRAAASGMRTGGYDCDPGFFARVNVL
jgi:hypothetical protein